VFRTMFDDNSSGIHNRFELKGVKYQDCAEFLRWIYPSSVKTFEEDGMSRMVALAKRFNVPFIVEQIARFLQKSNGFHDLKTVLFFGYEFSCSLMGRENIDLKSAYKQIENTPAYKAMDNRRAREMFEWMIKIWSEFN
ncbi:hypothetical protein PMAYCL1PPCAC_25216, partial [Pristionchus mayeri]